jgi:hypothetical protein
MSVNHDEASLVIPVNDKDNGIRLELHVTEVTTIKYLQILKLHPRPIAHATLYYTSIQLALACKGKCANGPALVLQAFPFGGQELSIQRGALSHQDCLPSWVNY